MTLHHTKLVFLTDPGHGWLAVPIEYLAQLGIVNKITSYSYFDSSTSQAYLEEDLDAGTFVEAAKVAGWVLEVTEHNEPTRDSFVRGLPPYPYTKSE